VFSINPFYQNYLEPSFSISTEFGAESYKALHGHGMSYLHTKKTLDLSFEHLNLGVNTSD